MSAATRAEKIQAEDVGPFDESSRPLDESTVALEETAVMWIRGHPWTSVAGAMALGFLVARLMRRER